MDKGPLGVHEVKLVVQVGPGFSNGCCVGETAHSTLNLGQVTSRNHSGRLVVDSNLNTVKFQLN